VITVILLPMTSTISTDAPYRSSTKIARACALLSGVTGLVAGLLLVGDFALDNPTTRRRAAQPGWEPQTMSSELFSSRRSPP
jgi:hypothetical protein